MFLDVDKETKTHKPMSSGIHDRVMHDAWGNFTRAIVAPSFWGVQIQTRTVGTAHAI